MMDTRKPALVAGAIAAIALLATGLLALADPHGAAFAWLTAFADVCGIAVASLLLLGSFHAVNARWMTALRRPLECAAASTLFCALLFVPVAVTLGSVFPWALPPDRAALSSEDFEMLVHRREVWLNAPFWVLRAALYFASWCVPALLLRHWSRRADREPALATDLLAKQRALGAALLPLVGVTMTFAAFDWLMSLEPLWFSTIFGVYWFAGSFVAAIAVLTLAVALPPGRALFGDAVREEHLHNLGNLLLAFVAFWAYIAFSQLLLVWMANLPRETPFYAIRAHGSWLTVSLALLVVHFVIPFFALLRRNPKRRASRLAFWSLWILAAHHLDVYWLVVPVLRPASAAPHLADATAIAGAGAAVLAFALFSLRGAAALPVGDPTLEDSRRYVKA